MPRTSKILLVFWVIVGLALLVHRRESLDTNTLALYITVLGVLVWNRVDSRRKAYSVTVGSLSVKVDNSDDASN
jgi:hypothetical protein